MRGSRFGTSATALLVNIGVGVLLYFALTETLLIFEISGNSLIDLIQDVAGPERALSRDFIIAAVKPFGVDLENYANVEQYSVISGAERLYATGNDVAATAIVIFSIIFPILKLISGLIHALIGGDSRLQRLFIQLHRLSMLDVFVAAIVVFVIGRSTGYEVGLGTGFYVFLAYWGAQYLANVALPKRRALLRQNGDDASSEDGDIGR